MKTTIAEIDSDLGLLTQQTFWFSPRCSGYGQQDANNDNVSNVWSGSNHSDNNSRDDSDDDSDRDDIGSDDKDRDENSMIMVWWYDNGGGDDDDDDDDEVLVKLTGQEGHSNIGRKNERRCTCIQDRCTSLPGNNRATNICNKLLLLLLSVQTCFETTSIRIKTLCLFFKDTAVFKNYHHQTLLCVLSHYVGMLGLPASSHSCVLLHYSGAFENCQAETLHDLSHYAGVFEGYQHLEQDLGVEADSNTRFQYKMAQAMRRQLEKERERWIQQRKVRVLSIVCTPVYLSLVLSQ